jgi:hypothetical protein
MRCVLHSQIKQDVLDYKFKWMDIIDVMIVIYSVSAHYL